MVAITALRPGDLVFSVQSQVMGNTTMRRKATFSVRVVSVHADSPSPHVIASWNGNPPRKFFVSAIRKWRRTRPPIRTEGLSR